MRSFLLSLFFLPSLAFAIQGGVPVEPGSAIAASTVELQFQMGKPAEWWPHCSAVLVAEDLAVTAAHCVPNGPKAPPLRIAFTTDSTQGNFPTRPITGYLRDENFQEKVLHEADDHDLALVRFSGGIPAGFSTVRLLTSQAARILTAGDQVTVAGFGSEKYEDYEMGILRSATVKIAKPLLGTTEILFDQRPGGGACSGDSGGPAYVELNGEVLLLGIASRPWPLHVDDCAQYIIYTRADLTTDWLEQAAADLRR